MAFTKTWLASISLRSCGATAVALLCAACPAGDDASATSDSTSTTDGESTVSPSTSSAATSSASTSTTEPATSTGPDESSTSVETGSSSTGTAETGSGSSSSGGCTPGTEDCACDAGTCDEGLECVDEVCVNPFGCREDVDAEANDDEPSAIDLGEHECGTLAEMPGNADNTDIDWWTYQGVDTGGCGEDTIAIVNADQDLEVCMYFECDMGNAQVVCSAASSDATSDEGRPGCCGMGSTQYTTTSCLGAATSDSGSVYISVSGPEDPVCLTYDLAYRFLD